MEIFKSKINDKKHMDRKEILKNYQATFSKLCDDADSIIKKNEYNPVDFKGIILCYLNYYDFDKFNEYFISLNNETKNEELYDILLTFYPHFKNPVNSNCDYLSGFIKYSAKKDFNSLVEG